MLQFLRCFSIILMITALIACGSDSSSGDGSSSGGGGGGGGGGDTPDPVEPKEPIILGGPGGNQIIATSLAVTGQEYEFEGEMYTVVDNKKLKDMLLNGTVDDLEFYVTTRVTKVLGKKDDQDPGQLSEYFDHLDNPNISRWDVSNFETMESLLNNLILFNQDISNWDVSKVKNMDKLFSYTKALTSDLSKWDVSNVESMEELFSQSTFNKNISSWNVSNVKNMTRMFQQATDFNYNLSNWVVDNVDECTDFADNNSVFDSSNWPQFTKCIP